MKKFLLICIAVACSLVAVAEELLIEAESFSQRGGWVLDQQFMDQMGSPYLMAHGMGIPVVDATAEINIPQAVLTTYMPVLTTGLHLGPMPRAPESSAWL